MSKATSHRGRKHHRTRKAPPAPVDDQMPDPALMEAMAEGGGEPGASAPAAGAPMPDMAEAGTGYSRGGRTNANQREALHKHRRNRSSGGR